MAFSRLIHFDYAKTNKGLLFPALDIEAEIKSSLNIDTCATILNYLFSTKCLWRVTYVISIDYKNIY
jgi:hypothetical protein